MMCFRTGTAVVWFTLSIVSGPLRAEETDINQIYEPELFQALEYRLIGPYRGGRVTAVTGVAGDLFTYYMGSAGGGVWKTTSGGQTWENLSDGFFEAGSIGAVTVAELAAFNTLVREKGVLPIIVER